MAPLGFALYFLESGRRRWFIVSLVVALLVKEEMGLVGIAFGAYAWLGKRDWKLGLGVIVGSLAAFVAIIELVIPYFASGRSYPYISGRYADVGGSPLGILRTTVTNPLRIVRAVFQAPTRQPPLTSCAASGSASRTTCAMTRSLSVISLILLVSN